LEAKRADESTTDVLEINTSGTRPPFVFLHAALQGDGFYCFNLARHLGDDQPMFALAPLGLDGTETPPTVETIAAKQLQIIRRIQPRGPYYLGGFCCSGPVAFELARVLKAAGERGRPATISAREHALSQAVRWRYDRAIEGFVPKRYDGPVVALRAEASIDTTAAWRKVAPDLRVQVVKGDHNTCITTQVDSLGTQLRNVLREAQERVLATPATHSNAGAEASFQRVDDRTPFRLRRH